MQYDSSDSTPSMAFNVLASYANAWKFNDRQRTAVTALKIIPCFSCSSSTTNVARQLATVRRRYGGPASFNYGGRPVCLPMIFITLDLGLHSSFEQGGSARVPRVPRVHFCTFGWNQIPGCRVWRLGVGPTRGTSC